MRSPTHHCIVSETVPASTDIQLTTPFRPHITSPQACGEIFCQPCSDTRANIIGYREPQRVCRSCFSRLRVGFHEIKQVQETEAVDDSFLLALRAVPGNDRCADCAAREPTWASISLGTLICLNCAGMHRDFGVSVSFVQSLTLDYLKEQHRKPLVLGGNRAFHKAVLERLAPHVVGPRSSSNAAASTEASTAASSAAAARAAEPAGAAGSGEDAWTVSDAEAKADDSDDEAHQRRQEKERDQDHDQEEEEEDRGRWLKDAAAGEDKEGVVVGGDIRGDTEEAVDSDAGAYAAPKYDYTKDQDRMYQVCVFVFACVCGHVRVHVVFGVCALCQAVYVKGCAKA